MGIRFAAAGDSQAARSLEHGFLRLLSVALLLLFISAVPINAASFPAAGPGELHYVINPFSAGEYSRTHVEVTFLGDAQGSCKLLLPSGWSGGDNDNKSVENVHALSPQTTLVDTDAPNIKLVRYTPRAEVRIAYDIRQSPGHEAGSKSTDEKPYFYHFGEALWAVPDWDEKRRITIALSWENLPHAWSLCNSYGSGKQQQTFRDSIADFRHGSYLGGDFRLSRFTVKGQVITVARRGQWSFSDTALDAVLHKLYNVQSDFWGNARFLYPLVILFPTDAPAGNFGGEGRTRCFDLFLPQRDTLSWGVLHLLSHELFHSWNPAQLRWDGEQAYWFTEGFTDYYAASLLVRSGLASPADFLDFINRTLRGYYLSPNRNHSYRQLMQERDQNFDADRMIYMRGCLQALNWEAAIRSATGGKRSLMNVMRDLLLKARNPLFTLNNSAIAVAAGKYLGASARDAVQRYMEIGETLMPRADAFEPRAALNTVTLHRFDLGFDAESFSARRITAVRTDSNAYRAGVRDGQKITAGGFQPGNPDALVQLKVADAAGERTVTYYPRGETLEVPQYQSQSSRNGFALDRMSASLFP